MKKNTGSRIAIALITFAAFAGHAFAQTSESTQPATPSVPPLPSLLKGSTTFKFNGREYKSDITLGIAKQDGSGGEGYYTRFDTQRIPPCNHYNNAPMTFQWDGVNLSVVVLKGDQCERQFALKRGVEHYFVLDDPNGNFHVIMDTAQ